MPSRRSPLTTEQARRARSIRRLREAAGLTQRALARAAGVSESFLQAVELGSRVPGPDALASIAAALGVPGERLDERVPPAPRKRWPALAARVRRAREAAGLLQRELAAAAAVSPTAVQQIETGRLVPSSEALHRIAAVLRLPAAELQAEVARWRAPEWARAMRDARKAADLSRFQLAVRAGVTESYVTNIETGRRRPSAEAARRIGEVLGVAPEALAGDRGSR